MAKTTTGLGGQGVGWLLTLVSGLALSGLAFTELAEAQTMDPTEPADPTEAAPKGPAPKGPTTTGPAPKAAAAAAGGGDAAEGGGDAGEEEEVVEETPEPEPAPPPEPPPADDGEDFDALAPSTRPWLAEFGVGPGIFMLACARGRCQDAGGTTQVKMSQIVGYHVNGTGEGFAIGLGLNEAFGSGLFRFQPGLRLWGDIPVADDLAIYISPYGQLGYSLYTVTLGGFGGTAHFFNWQAGVSARLILGDRFALSFTPLGFDWVANGDGMIWSYDLSFGFGATF